MGAAPGPEADYLVVGAGALGMGFVDALLDGSDADVVLVDKRHAPGGHWLDAYPFVQLHQPSANYGVNSTPLGRGRREASGRDAGFYERATGAEICTYFGDVLRDRMAASGRVRFLPMSEHLGDGVVRSLLTDEVTQVGVRRSIVDATYMASRIPACDPPPFSIAEGVRWVPVGGLASVEHRPAGYVVIGAGKTALDAVGWLLDRGVGPDDITWIRPREPWLLNRHYFQPGDGVFDTFEGIVEHVEAVAECDSIAAVYERMEQQGLVLRLDRSVEPTMARGATVSVGELEQLRRVERVVRAGRVQTIEPDRIVLDHATVPTSPEHLHVHCASAGLPDSPPRAIFEDDRITLQPLGRVSPSFSAGLIGFVESTSRSTDEKNRLCVPNPWPQTPFDWTRHILLGVRSEGAWIGEDDVRAWVDASRLNLTGALPQVADRDGVRALQNRFFTALFPALENFERLAADATPAERARIYPPL
jgi:hypothetical protein